MSWFNMRSERKKDAVPPSYPCTDVAWHPAPAGPEGSCCRLALSVGDLGFVIGVGNRVYKRLVFNRVAGSYAESTQNSTSASGAS